MPSTQHHIEYPPPLTVGPPSPATSVGSRHPDDTTSTSDSESILPQPLFERKWADKIGLGHPREEELRANKEPLLARPPQDSDEERQLFGAVLENLRKEVRALGEDEIFQKTLLRGSVAALHEPILINDIDAIMCSMMNPPSTRAGFGEPQPSFPKPQCTPGPWNTNETRHGFGAGLDSVPGSGSTMGRRTKGKGASSRRVP
ncbi:hypothetical protein E1B28_012168 [Marasmius oreades]|uniref:Uncharacterized protein n=1 Tax=Marasmius oreades TaxID=181124 RepID=A0A9P7RRX6_9AGAR|nr:uncharacterized protein E1B28_012168 [Marasmius oreades]KAG7088146.1 hypothetical protein E1B28_012168 [Marasmius oreades]